MARIPNQEIERLKREIPIERLMSGFGVELKRTGANMVGRCPFHDDRTAVADRHAGNQSVALHGNQPRIVVTRRRSCPLSAKDLATSI